MQPRRSALVRAFALPLVALLAALGVLLAAGSASAATVTVTLTFAGPNPGTADAAPGDKVVFDNTDVVTHVVSATGKNWTYKATVNSGSSASHTFPAAGTFTYSDVREGALGSTTATGSVVVAVAKPSPTPTATGSARPSASASASARPSASSAGGASPGAFGSPTPVPTKSGESALPDIIPGIVPTPVVTPSGGPPPQLAAPVSGGTTNSPAAIAPTLPDGTPSYAPKSTIAQTSAHRFGLPVGLAVVAVIGVVSLLVRLLLSQPEARGDHPEVTVQ